MVTSARAALWSGASPACPLCDGANESLVHMFAECRCVAPAWEWGARLLGAPAVLLSAAERTLSATGAAVAFARRAVVLACRRAIWLQRCQVHHRSTRPNAFRLVARCAAELCADIELDLALARRRASLLAAGPAVSLWAAFWGRWKPLRRFLRPAGGGSRLALADPSLDRM